MYLLGWRAKTKIVSVSLPSIQTGKIIKVRKSLHKLQVQKETGLRVVTFHLHVLGTWNHKYSLFSGTEHMAIGLIYSIFCYFLEYLFFLFTLQLVHQLGMSCIKFYYLHTRGSQVLILSSLSHYLLRKNLLQQEKH